MGGRGEGGGEGGRGRGAMEGYVLAGGSGNRPCFKVFAPVSGGDTGDGGREEAGLGEGGEGQGGDRGVCAGGGQRQPALLRGLCMGKDRG